MLALSAEIPYFVWFSVEMYWPRSEHMAEIDPVDRYGRPMHAFNSTNCFRLCLLWFSCLRNDPRLA